ncbi:MAG: 4-phosphoerythronate dehydrogenase [Bacteroidota bacterium]
MLKQKPVIVVNRSTPFAAEVFAHLGEVIALESAEVTNKTVRDADILIVRSETKVDKTLLEGSRVRFVGTVTIGTDHIDRSYLNSKGITFASAPGSNANSVAEYVVAGLLTWVGRTGQSLKGKTIGIVGVGNVGSKVVNVVLALGMIPLLNDPPRARKESESSFLPLDELMNADFITLHVPLATSGDDATLHLFDKQQIGKMKRGSVLINTSRGAVVETAALQNALASTHLSTAILDVWEHEPVINKELLDRVMLGTPHIAGYSLDGKLNALKMVYEDVCNFLDVQPDWSVDAGAPEGSSRLQLPAHLKNEMALAFAVRQAYDIELDDSLLREASAITDGRPGEHFMNLRAEYRIRREFGNFEVQLYQVGPGAVLQQLGFRTLVQETARL